MFGWLAGLIFIDRANTNSSVAHIVEQTGIKLTNICLCLPVNAGILGICHHCQAISKFLVGDFVENMNFILRLIKFV